VEQDFRPGLMASVRKAIERGTTAAQDEQAGYVWTQSWNSDVFEYRCVFGSVFSIWFNDFLDKRRNEGKVYALDLMSTSAMLTGLKIDGGVAVGLGNITNELSEEQMRERNITYIAGNLLKIQPWNSIKDWLGRNNADGFDLITCRANLSGCHSEYVPRFPSVYYALLDRAWNLLNKNGGVLLVDAPWLIHLEGGIPRELVNDWLKRLKQANVECLYKEGTN